MEDKNTQVRNYVLGLLESGEWAAGGKLPGARSIGETLKISLLTVQNALETLVKEGLLRVVPRQGTYVDRDWQCRILQSNVSFYVPWSYLPWGEYFHQRVQEQLPHLHFTTKMPHSVFEIVATAEVQSRHEQYLDLEPLLEKCFPDRSDFFEFPLNSFYYGGKLSGVPILFSPRVMFFNPSMLAEADCPVPGTDWQWEDFIGCVRQLLRCFPADRVFPWHPSYYLWMNFVLRSGGALIDPQAADPVKIDSPETRRGLRLFRELRYELGIGGCREKLVRRNFESGELAFSVDARQTVGRLRRTGMTDWNVLPLPRIAGGCNTSIQATELLCVRKECVDLETAEALIRILLSEEFQNHLAELQYAIPLRKSAAARSLAADDSRDRLFEQEAAVMQSQYHLDSVELFNLVSGGINELFWGDEDIEAGTAELAEMVRLYVKINRKITIGQITRS